MSRQVFKFKNDLYKKARGGYSRLLDLYCVSCGSHICYYQKDGPGLLKRLYTDRISEFDTVKKQLFCPNCKLHLGTKIVYEKERRPAYRLFVGAITKKIIKSS